MRELDAKKPQLEELVLLAETMKNDTNRQHLKDKGESKYGSNLIFVTWTDSNWSEWQSKSRRVQFVKSKRNQKKAIITATNKYRRTYSIHNPFQSVASINHIANGSTQDMQITTQTVSEPINKYGVGVVCAGETRVRTLVRRHTTTTCHASYYTLRAQATNSMTKKRVLTKCEKFIGGRLQ